jgi:hypothetical protein
MTDENNQVEFDDAEFNDEGYDMWGFDEEGIHKDTETKYDLNGFDVEGIHCETGTKLNPEGEDIAGGIGGDNCDCYIKDYWSMIEKRHADQFTEEPEINEVCVKNSCKCENTSCRFHQN